MLEKTRGVGLNTTKTLFLKLYKLNPAQRETAKWKRKEGEKGRKHTRRSKPEKSFMTVTFVNFFHPKTKIFERIHPTRKKGIKNTDKRERQKR